jgi:hypothetical protein
MVANECVCIQIEEEAMGTCVWTCARGDKVGIRGLPCAHRYKFRICGRLGVDGGRARLLGTGVN